MNPKVKLTPIKDLSDKKDGFILNMTFIIILLKMVR